MIIDSIHSHLVAVLAAEDDVADSAEEVFQVGAEGCL